MPLLAAAASCWHIITMPKWTPRNTDRAQKLRREATPAERALWVYLSRSGLGVRFNRQMPAGPFFADFLCRKLKLVIELDGHSHDIDPQRDVRRDRWLQDHGYTVLHFTNDDVRNNIEGVVTAIKLEVERLKSLPPAGGKRDLSEPSD
ncbi:endonuclease domain-containing protein [Pontixanthobacter sp.]|uniref:endonuclease domain-containing protein n=1 Tax=Pontixanthobacter sp. TaxID=2792078 RepID=UPI003C79E74E